MSRIDATRAEKACLMILCIIMTAIFTASCMPAQQTPQEVSAPGPAMKVICTTLPVYTFTAHVLITRQNISLELLVPPKRDVDLRTYTLTPEDTERLKAAKMLIINGLGMEGGLADAAVKANPSLIIVDSSKGIDSIKTKDGAVNPYVWLSPGCAVLQVRNIQDALIAVDKAGEKEISRKSTDYIKTLEKLQKGFEEVCQSKRVIAGGDFLAYLARGCKMEIVQTLTTEETEKIKSSPEQILKENEAGALFLPSSGKLTSAPPVYYFDTCMKGSTYPDNYEKSMQKNLDNMNKAFPESSAEKKEK
ncbi:MAG: metal ABC transporter substrate-binding protein [Vulcanimicrobiota bacterium]